MTGHEPAFPFIAGDQSNPDDRATCEGLTIRQYFAAMAMQGLLASRGNMITKEGTARQAIEQADALIEQLNKT